MDRTEKYMDELFAMIDLKTYDLIGYGNVFEPGDRWVKIQGCEACKPERRIRCCGKCQLVTEKGCWLQLGERGQKKPVFCVVHPSPDHVKKDCALEFKCVFGTRRGKIRRLTDDRNIPR